MAARLKRGIAIRRIAPIALMPAAAFAVHQLRYWLAFGNQAGMELQRQGHSYLHSVVPWLVLLIALATGAFLRALGNAFGGRRSLPRYTTSFAAMWLLCAASLVAIYATQEFLEGLFATGHPGGLVGIFGFGGWWSIPAAAAVGLVLAAAFHGARWVLREVFERYGRLRAAVRRPPPVAPAPRALVLPRLAPLAGGWSGRGPPR
ncbi:MAG TPA: hypothetical protein VGL78_04610 [Solirubrobacteraceae bacterium]|jgi:hypothetical protein